MVCINRRGEAAATSVARVLRPEETILLLQKEKVRPLTREHYHKLKRGIKKAEEVGGRMRQKPTQHGRTSLLRMRGRNKTDRGFDAVGEGDGGLELGASAGVKIGHGGINV